MYKCIFIVDLAKRDKLFVIMLSQLMLQCPNGVVVNSVEGRRTKFVS